MTTPLPLDWDQWRLQWNQWLLSHSTEMKQIAKVFPGKNFLADEILGTWKVNGRTVELSECVFPNLEDRDPVTGRLLEGNKRRIGVTFEDGSDVVSSFRDLELLLGLELLAEDKECLGHESLDGPIGNVVYCDGSCREPGRFGQGR